MIPLMGLWTAAVAAITSVTALSVVPADDRTEVVIAVQGAVSVTDFMLENPARLVIDLSGAKHALPRERFMGIDRGGVLAVRTSQYQPSVVRVVVELAYPVEYTLDQTNGAIRVSFPNHGDPFDPWYTAGQFAAEALGGAMPSSDAGESVRTTAVPASPAPAAPADRVPAAGPAPDRGHATSAPARSQEPPITVYFQNTPMMDVLSTFAEFSGRSIVPGAAVQGSVTADIRGQPWDVALEAILTAHGLTAREMESGIIRVDALEKMRDREKVEDMVTRQYPIKYATADSLVNTVKTLISDRGNVSTNPSANALVITDARSVLERIEPAIMELDVRRPQVTISAKIIFVDRTALEELGITYDLKDVPRGNQLNELVPGFVDADGDGQIGPGEQTNESVVLLGGNSIAALANAKYRPIAPALEILGSLALGRYSLITFIDALQTLQLSDIQATPVVTVMNNREARILVGEETPIRVIDVGTGQGGGGVPPRATVQMKETGVILRVKPHVTGDQVLLDLHAERSNIALAPSDIGVTFQTQESQTQVMVRDGETAVIGGLTIIEKSQIRSGIPFLMNIPIIGPLFRTTSDRETKKDLLIMVTPHIVRDFE